MAISGETAFTMGMVGMILIAGSFVMETTGNTSVPFGNIAESLLIIGASLMFIAVVMWFYLMGKTFAQEDHNAKLDE